MKSLKNIVGILPVLCVIDPSFAALRTTGPAASGRGDSRVGIVTASQAAARRIPTMASGSSVSSGSSTSTSTTTTKSTAEEEADCISDYTDCIKGADACNSDFSECVNTDLFHGKMPQCNSILLRCPASGVQKLFGITSVTALGQKDGDTFLYPNNNSLMRQAIDAGEINNRLDTGSCVKKYMSCLNKENVCGKEFELCTSDTEFTKQRVYCESTLARCQTEGKTELFGSATRLDKAAKGSRIRIAIDEGFELAAANAVSSCYKAVDACFLKACAINPYRCLADITFDILGKSENSDHADDQTVTKTKHVIDAELSIQQDGSSKYDESLGIATLDYSGIGNGSNNEKPSSSQVTTKKDVSGYIKNNCLSTIGTNALCHITFSDDNKMPTAGKLVDPDIQEEIFEAAYSNRMDSGMQMRINDLRSKFDRRVKDACAKVIMDCAMSSCGKGVGSKCYACAKGDNGAVNVNGTNTYDGIKAGCEAIVNSNPNCIYAAATYSTPSDDLSKYLSLDNYSKSSVFTTLFPAYGNGDPMGVVAKLNASLAENYNEKMLEEMAKVCKSTTRSCIETMCGADYSNCYRNRTDIVTDAYNTKDTAFDNSMNKVNGILDFTVIRGLCNDIVKGSEECEEYLKIQSADDANSCSGTSNDDAKKNNTWGAKLGDQWSNTAQGYKVNDGVKTGYCSTKTDLVACEEKKQNGVLQKCNTVDNDYCIYNVPEVLTYEKYKLTLATDTLFQEVLKDVELKAQAQYNAKLTKEQNKCVSLNKGGVISNSTTTYGDTYAWVKFSGSNQVRPDDYEIKGLDSGTLTTSNDLYGSFCRIRVTLRSDEPAIQEYLQKQGSKVHAYFAAGDAFTCGSWLDGNALNEIAQIAAAKDVCQSLYTKNYNKKKNKGLDADGMKSLDKEIVEKCASGKLDRSQNLKAWLLAGGAGSLVGSGLAAGLSFGLDNSSLKGEDAWKGGVVTAASGIGGYLLTGGTTAAVMKAKNRDKFNEAQRQWMDEIGSHIQCYVGGDEAGSYGDAVQVTLD